VVPLVPVGDEEADEYDDSVSPELGIGRAGK